MNATIATPLTLAHFTGTEKYWTDRLFKAVRYTDGVKYLRDHGFNWLVVDLFAFGIPLSKKESFISMTLIAKDGKATLTLTDGNEKLLKRNDYELTDAPDGEYKLFLIDGVLLLASEY